MCVLYLIYDLNNQSCYCYFWWLECALCILYWMLFKFDQYILVGNPDISFGKCHCYCISWLVHDVLIYYWLYSLCERRFLIVCL
jgi:hypothetical protein